jgi:hypothetical protein
VASVRLASQAQGEADEVGKHEVKAESGKQRAE